MTTVRPGPPALVCAAAAAVVPSALAHGQSVRRAGTPLRPPAASRAPAPVPIPRPTPRAVRRRVAAPIRVTWLGHAGFEVVSPGGTRLLIDPWISGAAAPAAYRDSARYAAPATRPAAILVTHAHPDHDADAARLGRLSGAPVIATGDHLEAMRVPEGGYRSINVGGVQRVGDVAVVAVPAVHAVSPGHALGYVLRFAGGRALYHTGDTWVFGDMALVAARFHPDLLLVAAGGGRAGEDPATAAFAVRRYFRPRAVVPMHWGTLPPPFAAEAEVRAAFRGDPRLRVLVPGREAVF